MRGLVFRKRLKILRGVKGEPDDLFGNSVQSTMKVIQTAIYDIDHPLSGGSAKSIAEQQEARKEFCGTDEKGGSTTT